MALDENFETFVIHVTSLKLAPGIHLDKKAQIASLLSKEVKISDKYLDFTNVFLEQKALVLSKCTKLNKYIIDLENGKQLLYRLIYNLSLVKLEILKTYINIYLKLGFIWPFKSSAGIPILFNKKPDGSLCLCIDYQSLNNLIIKTGILYP